MTDIHSQITIAVVGDVHNLWDETDELALKHLGVDLVLFVGDFGNESLEIVSKIARVQLPKAVIMGNHDAWYTASAWGRKRAPYDRTKEDRVQQQLDLLGEAHVGFGKLDFPQFNLSVVGGRPFSWGGSNWRNQDFYRRRFGVNSFAESTARIVEAAQNATGDRLIFIGHSGPFGLGDRPEDICGRDWKPSGGDYGDPDLAEAIAQVRKLGKAIPLVTFGHMHDRLKVRSDRRRTMVCDDRETVYLNGAFTPRIIEERSKLRRNFSLVSLENGLVSQIALVWLDSSFQIVSNETLYTKPMSNIYWLIQ